MEGGGIQALQSRRSGSCATRYITYSLREGEGNGEGEVARVETRIECYS